MQGSGGERRGEPCERNGYGVKFVVTTFFWRQGQQFGDHPCNSYFVGGPIPSDCELNLLGREFNDANVVISSSRKNCPTRLPHTEGCFSVRTKKQRFNRKNI